jgi:hypothetical protein
MFNIKMRDAGYPPTLFELRWAGRIRKTIKPYEYSYLNSMSFLVDVKSPAVNR